MLLLARWMAADLFLRDVAALSASLSMSACTDAIRELASGATEPYRAVLKALRDRLFDTRAWAEVGGPAGPGVILRDDDLREPLQLCYESLIACGLDRIANGPLLDTLRRAHCFGVHLVNIDIRQHADRHTAVFDELTRYLYPDGGRGYRAWSETERHRWLLEQLEQRRPLFPAEWPASDDVREVIDTCAAIAEYNGAGISAYVVSMACAPSDVLAVALLLKEARVTRQLPIVPLFETLDDLDRAANTVDALLSLPWYRDYVHALDDGLQVMIGYSDSAKDAGQLAAAWAQYRAQEALTDVAAKHAVKLTLFHGRGGAVGRGGGPSAQAIESQPPGAVNGSFRVTEQGEMIRFKLGTPAIAKATLSHYLTATLNAAVDPPPTPSATMRQRMSELAELSLDAYRGSVRAADFVDFFQAITPEAELAALALGSRPARRTPARDLDSLRAIPWVFAWTQIRLMLPAWLGAESAFAELLADRAAFEELRRWPFFAMQADMLEMVLAKADSTLARYYARRLTTPDEQAMAEELFERLEKLAADSAGVNRQDRVAQPRPGSARLHHRAQYVPGPAAPPAGGTAGPTTRRQRLGSREPGVESHDGRHFQRAAEHRLTPMPQWTAMVHGPLAVVLATGALAAAAADLCVPRYTTEQLQTATVEELDGVPLTGEAAYGVSTITVIRQRIFNTDDPAEDNALFRLANLWHVNTREDAIRGLLLFTEGDAVNAARIAESERLLRRKRFSTTPA